jgi:hypothetical protein
MIPSSVFERNFELHQLPATLRLRNLDWGVYFTIDGSKTSGEIQAHFRLDDPQRDEVFTRLLQMELIREKKLNLQEHIEATALHADSSDSRVKSLDEFIRTGSSGTSAPLFSVAAPDTSAQPKPGPPSPMFTPLPPPSQAKTMSLLSVIRFIQEQSRDKTAGQLAVYRVFMGVDTRLLKKNGIQSLRFQDDRLITDPELQQSIAENVSKALRKSLPQSAYV